VVAVLPQPSVAVNVLVREREQPLFRSPPSSEVTVGLPHASVAVAEPSAAAMAAEPGLHPSAKGEPVALIVGTVLSSVHVALREVVAVLPQTSVAVNIRVCERKHPVVTIAPSPEVTLGVPQLSDADALPNAALIASVDGLQPRVPLVGVPVALIVGTMLSFAHCTRRDAVAVLPQASVAVNVLVCDFTQSPVMPLVSEVTVGVPQASVAVAEPSAASIAAEVGLHRFGFAVPVGMRVGAVMSTVQVAVREVVAVLPQASVAVNVLVRERKHPPLF